jgi:hypothetical protein
MRTLSSCALLAVSLALAQGAAVRAGAPDCSCSTPAPPCAPSTCLEAPQPKVIVEVPPPNVVIRACEMPCCAEREGFFKRCCHFGSHNCCVQPVYTVASAPMAYAPVAAPMTYAPMAAAPMAAPMSFAPMAAPMSFAPMAAPMAAPMSFAPMAAPMAAPTLSLAPTAAPMTLSSLSLAPTASLNLQPVASPQAVLVPVAANPAAPTNPTAPTSPTSDSGMDCNKALQKLTSQMETLTKVVEKHTLILSSHERRIQRMEDYLAIDPKDRNKPLPVPGGADDKPLKDQPADK